MSRERRGSFLPWLGSGFALLIFLAVGAYFFLPTLIFRWLGGDEFRRLASQQLSSVLKTEGELEPLTWSSFTVRSGGFTSKPGAAGPWLWKIQKVETGISVPLLLNRILRFPEILIDSVTLSPGTKPVLRHLRSPSRLPRRIKSPPPIYFKRCRLEGLSWKALVSTRERRRVVGGCKECRWK